MSFRVTAVVVFDNQMVPIGGGSGSGNIEPTALVSSFPGPARPDAMSYGNAANMRLRPGATVDSLRAPRPPRWRSGTRTPGDPDHQPGHPGGRDPAGHPPGGHRPRRVRRARRPHRARRHRPAAQPAACPGRRGVPRAARDRRDPRQPRRAVARQARHRHPGRRCPRRRRRHRGLPADADRPGPAGRAAPGRRGRTSPSWRRASPRSRCCRSRCWPAPPGGRRERPRGPLGVAEPSGGRRAARGSAARSPGPGR